MLGSALALSGDVNGDGLADFVVGAEQAWGGGASAAGSAFVFSSVVLPLHADTLIISAATGGRVDFSLDAGVAHAGHTYAILGSMSGSWPGIRLGPALLPLNFDAYFLHVIRSFGLPIYQNFLGQLDSNGRATAAFDTIAPFDPAVAGTQIWFAYLLVSPISGFASNAFPVELVP
ncbi:MAG: integrin alpha [Planctomycetota bacterium]